MAREFSDNDNSYLEAPGSPVTATPCTLSVWFYRAGQGNRCIFYAGGYDGAADHVFMVQQVSDTQFRAYTVAGGAFSSATATSGIVNETWQHGCGVWRDVNDRSAYLDGGNRGNDAGSTTPAVVTPAVRLGARKNVSQPWLGRLAESAIWNIDLSDPEVAMLARGYSPLLIRPQNLVMYVPLIRDADEDIIGGLSFAPGVTAPTIVKHPKVLYPRK